MPNERYRLANPCLHKLKLRVQKLYTRRIADENDSDLRYSEVLLKGKNKTLVKILGGRQHRTTPAGQILGVATPATPAALTPMTKFVFSRSSAPDPTGGA